MRTTTPRQRVVLIFFGLALCAVLLAGIELILGVARIGESHRFEDPFVGFAPGQTLFVLEPKENEKDSFVTRPEKLRFFNRQEFPARKGSRTLRIFCLGGSTTAGRPYDDKVSFSNWLLDSCVRGQLTGYFTNTMVSRMTNLSPSLIPGDTSHSSGSGKISSPAARSCGPSWE